MSTGIIVTNLGKKIAFHRLWTASPTYTVPSLFKVGTGTTTPSAGDTDLATAITIGGAATKVFVTGYPTLDETNFLSTVRCIVLTTECNANTLTEFGLFNTDATKKMFSRIVHTAITKTSAVQVIYVEKDRIV